MSSVSKPRVRQNRHKQGLNQTLEKISADFRFSSFSRFDSTFSVASIIPYSNYLEWNLDELKHQIWNGIVLSINNQIFDDSIPTIVLSGKTGCGKTSTINSLWNKNLATNRVASCTKFPAVMHIVDVF